MIILPTAEDGNCLFASLASIFQHPGIDHALIRQMIVHYIYQHPEVFQNDIAAEEYENVDHYCQNMSRIGFWGDGICVQAFAMLFKLNVWVCYSGDESAKPTQIAVYEGSPHVALLLNDEHYSRVLSW